MSSFALRCFHCYKRLENSSMCPNCREFLLPYFEEKSKEELLLDDIKSKVKVCEAEIEGLCKDLNAIKNDCKQLEEDYDFFDNEMPPLQDDTLECSIALEDKVKQLQAKTDSLFKSHKIIAEENKILSATLDYVSAEMQRQSVQYEQLSIENKNLQNVINQLNDMKLETGMKIVPSVNDLNNSRQDNIKQTINKTKRFKKQFDKQIDATDFADNRRKSEAGDECKNSKMGIVPPNDSKKLIQQKSKNMAKMRNGNGMILNIRFDK